jgi:predicted nuclease of predicted toxin-antitoxin system
MAARLRLDENLPRDARTLLVDAGHDAHSLIDEGLGGGSYPEVIDACLNENSILVTLRLAEVLEPPGLPAYGDGAVA